MQRFIVGQTIREISRIEGRARDTVARIVKSDEMQTFVEEMRERFYGLGCDALETLRHGLQEQKDGRLAYQLLTDIGVIPGASERQIPAPQPTAEDNENTRVQNIMSRLMRVAFERARVFGAPIGGQLEDDLKKVGATFDPTTGAIVSVDDKPADS